MIKAENYEVVKFIEHGGKCRIIMDCASGQLLVHRLKDSRGITKEQIFKWFKMLTLELDKYHRCKSDQCYRYLNPYSILVTAEEKILLLDLSAESNGFVLKNMQKPAMREHFVKPVIQIRENTRLTLDFYGLGKTMQFVLAHTEKNISLSRREEYLLSGIIEKCLGENPKRKYDNLRQIQKELPGIKQRKIKVQQKRTILIILAIVLILAGICALRAVSDSIRTADSGWQESVYALVCVSLR